MLPADKTDVKKVCALILLPLFLTHCGSCFGTSKVEERGPSSITPVFDFSHLQGSVFDISARQRLASSFQISKSKENEVGVALGNFVMMSSKGDKVFACGVFNRVVMAFEADGVSVGGQTPTLTVEVPCQIGDDIDRLGMIKIPLKKIKDEPAKDAEFQFIEDGQTIVIKAQDIPSQWPSRWILAELKLKSEGTGQTLVVNKEEFLRVNHHLFSMNWD